MTTIALQTADTDQIAAPKRGVGWFLRATLLYARPHWVLYLLLIITLIPTTAFFTIQPLIFKGIIDDAIGPGDVGRLAQLVAALAGLVVLRMLGEFGKEYLAARAGA